ncbi:MAG: hypothetical protein HQL79_11185 [Magnetococcales bacterium]|nr:hypothetical protein [Magnetococcales bacterium]
MVTQLKSSLPRNTRFRGVVVILLLLQCISVSATLAASPTMSQVMPLLQGYEWRDRPDAFLNLGEGTDQVLMDIAANADGYAVIRFRALAALRYFANPQVALFLENRIAREDAADMLRRELEAYVFAFGNDQPARVAQTTEPLLDHPDAQIRMRAAVTLQKLPRSAVSQRVQQLLDSGSLATGLE